MTGYPDKFAYERKYLAAGCRLIAGTDEVGRGPLAGPVVCAAVVMPLGEDKIVPGVDDSKKLSEKKREELSARILDTAIACKIAAVSAAEIDEINILQAVKKCMKLCVEGLSVRPDVLLLDAMRIDCDLPQVSIIKGDALSYTVGAASIVAKVYRDRLMCEYAEIYPGYGFERNKGYGTKEHIRAIREAGPCAIHRKTFIKNFWEGTASEERSAT